MLRVKPFRAIRPPAPIASRVASVPYDVCSTAEARTLADGNPDSFLHIIRPEIDLPDGTSPYDDSVYETARANLDAFLSRGTLVQDRDPGIFLYRQVMDGMSQIGVVGCCHIDDYRNNVIRKHEHTRPDKEDDRTRHVLTLNANTGPVFLTYRDNASIDELVTRDTNDRPLIHFDAPDGVTHSVWQVRDPQAYAEAFKSVDYGYVADGHHRSASAARAGAERRAAMRNATGDQEHDWFLCVLFPATQLRILAYNRLVKDLGAMTPESFLDALRAIGTLKPTDNPVPAQRGQFGIYVDGGWHMLELDPSSIDHDDPIRSLDVALLQERILTPMLGIGDPRTDPRIDFVGGIRGPGELKSRVDRGDAAVAISMHPTSIEELINVSDANTVMPPKSTWFEPKLRSGLFIHSLDS